MNFGIFCQALLLKVWFFSLIFLFFFNFIVLHWIICPLALLFFSFFFLFGYYNAGLVKWTRVSSIFLKVFFCWTLFFLLGTSFEFLLFVFIMLSYCGLWVYQVNFNWLEFTSFVLYIYIYIYIYIDIKLLYLEFYDFFLLFFCGIFWFYIMNHALINLTRFFSNYRYLNIIFSRWENLNRYTS